MLPVHQEQKGEAMRESLYDYCKRMDMGWLLAEWDDVTCTPQRISYGSRRTFQWRCKEGHCWQAKVSDRIAGTGCPYCSGKRVVTGTDDLASVNPVLAGEWHPSKNGSLQPDQVSCSSKRKVWWQCENGHEWQAAIKARNAGSGCPYCSGRRVIPGENDLGTLYPELVPEWAEENGTLTPGDVGPYYHGKSGGGAGTGTSGRQGCPAGYGTDAVALIAIIGKF